MGWQGQICRRDPIYRAVTKGANPTIREIRAVARTAPQNHPLRKSQALESGRRT